MAETFNCPKCGAPIQFDAVAQANQKTLPCPYCGESVIIPAELRPTPPAPQTPDHAAAELEVLKELEYKSVAWQPKLKPVSVTPQVNPSGWIVKFAIFFIVLSVLITVITMVAIRSVTSNVVKSLALPTELVSIVEAKLTPTPSADIAATLAAQSALLSDQRQWPVVIQDDFSDNHLKWTTGTDNSKMALEEKTIAGGKYTWVFTSKQSVGSFSSPTMPSQQDQFVSVDVQMSTTGSSLDDKAGIMFRQDRAKGAFYFFGVSPNGGYSLSLYDGSDWQTLISPTASNAVKPDKINHLAVSMAGSQILLEINGQMVGSATDGTLKSGDAGFGLNLSDAGIDATVSFSNFSVRAPQQ